MCKFLKKGFSIICSFLFLLIQIMPSVIPKFEAATTTYGFLSGIEASGSVSDNQYIAYDEDFYSEISSNYTNGYKTEATALRISTAGQLAAFAKYVNAGHNFSGKYVRMLNDINLNGGGVTYQYIADGTDSTSNMAKFKVKVTVSNARNIWKPIGTGNSYYFGGTFDGGGHEVTNMVVFNSDYAGLFGYVRNGTIKNIGIGSGSSVYSYSSSYAYAGSLVGCVTSSSINNSYASGSVYSSSDDAHAGGLVGHVGGCSINNSYASGSVYSSSNDDYIGGLAGRVNYSSINNSYASGSVYSSSPNAYAGGLVGGVAYFSSSDFSSSINNSYASGSVYSYSSSYAHAGGLVGYVKFYTSSSPFSSINNSYASGSVYAYAHYGAEAGGLGGHVNFSSINNSYASGSVYAYAHYGAEAGGLGGYVNPSHSSINNSYATGNAYSSSSSSSYCHAGGFAGIDSSSDTVTSCYYNTSCTVQKNGTNQSTKDSSGAIATSLSNLKGNVAYTISGFNSDNAWVFRSGGYPNLKLKPLIFDQYKLNINSMSDLSIGATLTASTSSKITSPTALSDFSYVWTRDDGTQVGTGSTYELQNQDAQHNLDVTLQSTNSHYGETVASIYIDSFDNPLDVSFKGKVYDGQPVNPTILVDENGSELSHKYRVSGSGSSYTDGLPKDVGTYEIKTTQQAANGYAAKEIISTVTIEKKTLTPDFGDISFEKEYDGSINIALTDDDLRKISLQGIVDDENVDLNSINLEYVSENARENIGINVRDFGLSSTNYTLKTDNVAVGKINKRKLGLDVKIADKNYNGRKNADYDDEYTKIDVDRIVSEDDVSLATKPVANFVDAEVGDDKGVEFNGDFELEGKDRDNYCIDQPVDITGNIKIGFEPIADTHYTVSAPDGNNNWYKNDFIISAKSGYKISFENKDGSDWKDNLTIGENGENQSTKFYVRKINDASYEISREVVYNYNMDKIDPKVHININNNKFKEFMNTVTFGLFFKNTVHVTMGTDESISGISKIYYLKSENEKSGEEIASLGDSDWTKIVDNPKNNSVDFWVDKNDFDEEKLNDKFFVYAKFVNNAGNSVIINSNGVVLYTDSEVVTKSIEHIKFSNIDYPINVKLNGNSVQKLILDDGIIVESDNYTIENSNIKISSNYLDDLYIGDHVLNIIFNPAGKIYNESSEYQNLESPAISQVTLSISKSNQTITSIKGLQNSYTYGDNNSQLSIVKNDKILNENVSYVSSNTDVAVIENGNTLKIVGVGSFKITAKVESDNDYNSAEFTSRIINVAPKIITISEVKAISKTYDGNTNAGINIENAKLIDLVAGDENYVSFSAENAQANFSDKISGPNKAVTFSGFELTGEKARNYTLNQPPIDYSSISKKDVYISGLTVENKVYNGNDNAIFNADNAQIVDIIIEDNVIITSGSAKFDDKNVGNEKIVIFTGFSLSGDDAQNYNLSSQPDSMSANITKCDLNITLSVSDKQYDGLNIADFAQNGAPGLVNLYDGDDITLSGGTPSFSSVEVGKNIPINFEIFEIYGRDAENYNLMQPTGVTANIFNDFIPEKDVNYTISSVDGDNNWYRVTDFVITGGENYLVSESNTADSEWNQSLVYSSDTSGQDITFYVRNKANSAISNAVVERYKKDSVCPEVSILIGENRFNKILNTITFGMFFKNTVKVTIDSQDENSGIAKTEYFKSDDIFTSESEFIKIENWELGNNFSVEPDQKFITYAKVTDNAGNVTYMNSEGVIVNVTPITVCFDQNFDNTQWISQDDAKIDVSVANKFPVIRKVSYKIGNFDMDEIDVDNKSNVNFSIENLPDGIYDMIVSVTDEYDSIIEKMISIKKDTVGPSIISVDTDKKNWTNNTVILTVNAQDELSGINESGYSFDGGNSWQKDKNFNYETNQVISAGTIKVKDLCGNISSYDKDIIIENIDKIKPNKVVITGASDEWQSDDIILKVNADDADETEQFGKSEIDFFEYSLDEGNSFSRVKWSDSHEFKISENGDYTNKICVRVTDKAGNVSDLSDFYTVKLNKNVPVIDSVQLSNSSEWTNEDVSIVVTAHDDISGLAEAAYSFDRGKNWQESGVKICATNIKIPSEDIQIKNASGLISTYDSDVIIENIDKLKPNKPRIDGATGDVWQNKEIIMTVVSNDENQNRDYGKSGIDYFEYTLDGENFEKVNWSEDNNNQFKISNMGEYNKIAVKVTDKAGNVSNLSDYYSAKLRILTEFKQMDSKNDTGTMVEAPKGVFPQGAKLEVEKLDRGTSAYNEAHKGLDENLKNIAKRKLLYDINVKDESQNIVQPDLDFGHAIVRILIPDDFDKNNLEVYRVQPDSPDDAMNARVVEIDGKYYCEFETDHFSTYALIEKIDQSDENTDEKRSQNQTEENNKKVPNKSNEKNDNAEKNDQNLSEKSDEKNADIQNKNSDDEQSQVEENKNKTYLSIILITLALLIIFYLVYKKYKQNVE